MGPPKEVVLRTINALKNLSLSAGFEAANFGCNSKHDIHESSYNASRIYYAWGYFLHKTITIAGNV
jgi:hypothetical protein